MAEYIEREAVHNLVQSLTKYAWASPDNTGHRVTVDADDVNFGVDKIPSADVAPVRHGRWLKIEEHTVLAYNTYFPMTTTSETCSECNVRSAFLGKKGYVKDNSCPNCGAKMDGERKGEANEP